MFFESGDHLFHLGEVVRSKHVFLPHALLADTFISTVTIKQILNHSLVVLSHVARVVVLREKLVLDVIVIITIVFLFLRASQVIIIHISSILSAVHTACIRVTTDTRGFIAWLSLLPQFLPFCLKFSLVSVKKSLERLRRWGARRLERINCDILVLEKALIIFLVFGNHFDCVNRSTASLLLDVGTESESLHSAARIRAFVATIDKLGLLRMVSAMEKLTSHKL